MKIIAVDFDGVIHAHRKWEGHRVIPGPPVEGAFEFLREAVKRYEVIVHSTRFGDHFAIRDARDWMRKHGLDEFTIGFLQFSIVKPPALLFLDDRAIRFEGPGRFPSFREIEEFTTWWEKDLEEGEGDQLDP